MYTEYIFTKQTLWTCKLLFLHFRDGSVYAIVELVFGPSVTNPFTPLQDEMNDGKLGSYTVDRQLDVNLSMFNTTLPLCSSPLMQQMIMCFHANFCHVNIWPC